MRIGQPAANGTEQHIVTDNVFSDGGQVRSVGTLCTRLSTRVACRLVPLQSSCNQRALVCQPPRAVAIILQSTCTRVSAASCRCNHLAINVHLYLSRLVLLRAVSCLLSHEAPRKRGACWGSFLCLLFCRYGRREQVCSCSRPHSLTSRTTRLCASGIPGCRRDGRGDMGRLQFVTSQPLSTTSTRSHAHPACCA